MDKQETVDLLVTNLTARDLALNLENGMAEDKANAYAVINKEQIETFVSNAYDIFFEAELLK